MTPLRLSDSESTTIFGLARPLAPEVRDVFLQDIAARLAVLAERGDVTVYKIAAELQRKYFDPPEMRETTGPLPRRYAQKASPRP